MKNFFGTFMKKTNSPSQGTDVVATSPQKATIAARVIRKDGTVQDLGVIARPEVDMTDEEVQRLKAL